MKSQMGEKKKNKKKKTKNPRIIAKEIKLLKNEKK